MRLAVDRDGTTEEVDVDLALDYFTPPEAERAAKGLATLTDPDELATLRVLTWAKVVTHFPDLPLDGFELEPPTEIDPAEIPMEPIADG
jgi:hypothetical protein